MAENPYQLADVLSAYVSRSGYTTGQLAKLTGIPKPTIVNWVEGRVRRPRSHRELLQLAAVLHLDEAEANHLLAAAGHPTVTELRASPPADDDARLADLLAPWPKAASSPPAPAPFQAMADLPTFVGREEEINTLLVALQAETHTALYSIQGMSGTGKTCLAAHLAYRLRPAYSDGILWARVDTSDSMSILSTFAQAFGVDVTAQTDLDSRSRVVRELLAPRRTLIILDNVQHSEQVKPLLPPTGRCAVLVTTRRHDLSVLRGAYRLVLPPFRPERGESLALFARILGRERVIAERDRFRDLAAILGHLPLAIDIAASRLAYEPGWSTEAFWQRLRQSQRRLAELAYEDQSVRLSFDASFGALTPAEQQFMAGLSLFAGDDFSAAAAAAVAGMDEESARDTLRRLYGLSLVQPGRGGDNGGSIRYQLHPLLRDYAHRHLQDPAAETRLVRYFVTYAERQPRHVPALEREQSNLLAALALAREGPDPALFVRGVTAVYFFLEARGLLPQAARLLAEAEAALPQQADPAARLAIDYRHARLAQLQGEYIEAETRYEAALEQARTLQDRHMMSHILRALGVMSARQGDYGLADAYYKEGLAVARQLGHGGAVSDFLRGLGVQAYIRGDYARAEAFYAEGLALMESDDEEGPAASSAMLWGLGTLAQEQGDQVQAEAYYRQALAQAREVGTQERIIVLLRSLAVLQAEVGQPAATDAFAEALALARQLGHRWQQARVLSELGEWQLAQEETAAAEETYAALYELARILHSQELVAVSLYGQARVAAAAQDVSAAAHKGRQALDTFTAVGHYQVQQVQAWLADLLR